MSCIRKHLQKWNALCNAPYAAFNTAMSAIREPDNDMVHHLSSVAILSSDNGFRKVLYLHYHTVQSLVLHAAFTLLAQWMRRDNNISRQSNNAQRSAIIEVLTARLRGSQLADVTRDALIKCTVDLAVATWPQLWPDFTNLLDELQKVIVFFAFEQCL